MYNRSRFFVWVRKRGEGFFSCIQNFHNSSYLNALMFKYTQIGVKCLYFSKSNIFILVPRSPKVLIMLPSGNLQVICKNDDSAWIPEYKDDCIILHKLFSTHYNQRNISNIPFIIKMIILWAIFLKNMPFIKTHLSCKFYKTLKKMLKSKTV